MPQAKKSGSNTAVIILVVLLLALVGFGVWWFMFRKEEKVPVPIPSTPQPDKSKYISKLYGNSDLSEMYYISSASQVKRLRIGEKCAFVGWSLTDTSITIDGKSFSIVDSNTIKDSDGKQYDLLDGPIDDYCKLIGE